MKKTLLSVILSVTLCATLILCNGGTAMAAPTPALFVIEIGVDKVVYDETNGTYWYPHLPNMIQMTKAQQQDYIDQLNTDAYGGVTDWHFANYDQMMGLRESLAGMAPNLIEYEFPGTPPGTPRTVSSPFLAYPIHPDQLFTPTAVITIPFFGGVWETMPIQVFNGRVDDGWAWRRDGWTDPPDVDWRYGEADDHFMVHSLMTTGDPYATMMFNADVHYLPDDATYNDMVGDVGAWVVSETGPPILAYYLGLGNDPNVAELSDVVQAANDYLNGIIPLGFTAVITLGEVVWLANEWLDV